MHAGLTDSGLKGRRGHNKAGACINRYTKFHRQQHKQNNSAPPMDSAPVLLPSPRKSPFHSPYESRTQFHQRYSHDNNSSDEDAYGYDQSPDEAVFDEDSQDDSQDSSQSPHTSDDDIISEIPTDVDSRAPSTIYTPHKRRSPFRHPSSVRNLQLDTTPPHLTSPTKSAYRLSPSPQSRSNTPRSVYSNHSRPRSARSSPAKKEKVNMFFPVSNLVLRSAYAQAYPKTVDSAFAKHWSVDLMTNSLLIFNGR